MVRPKSFYLELVQVWHFFATVVQEFDGIFESFDIFLLSKKVLSAFTWSRINV
jgi:hypothetical protein